MKLRVQIKKKFSVSLIQASEVIIGKEKMGIYKKNRKELN
jgi:hypothetical protein